MGELAGGVLKRFLKNLSAHAMSLRIVVVDDNVDLVDSLVSVLELLGHQAVGATGGAEGVDSSRSGGRMWRWLTSACPV